MSASASGIAIYIDPPTHHLLDNRLFVSDERQPTGDRLQEPYAYVRSHFANRGISVATADHLPEQMDATRKIYVSLGRLNSYRRLAQRSDVILSAFFAVECPIVEPSMYRA